MKGGYQLLDVSKYIPKFNFDNGELSYSYDFYSGSDKDIFEELENIILCDKVIVAGNINIYIDGNYNGAFMNVVLSTEKGIGNTQFFWCQKTSTYVTGVYFYIHYSQKTDDSEGVVSIGLFLNWEEI